MSYLIQDVFADGVNVAKDKLRQALVGNVEKIAHLKALAIPAHNGTPVFVRGFDSPNDGGGGMFVWSTTSAATDDGGTVVAPTAATSTGRWLRVYDGAIDVKWFGALGDASTDDTLALQKALDLATATGGEVWVPTGIYRHLTLTIAGPLTLRGAGQHATVFKRLTNNAESFHVNYVANDSSGVGQRVVFEKFQIDGNATVNTGGDGILFADGAGYSTCFFGRDLFIGNVPARGLHAGVGRNAGVLDAVDIVNCVSHCLSLAGSDWAVGRCSFSGTQTTASAVYIAGSGNTLSQCTLSSGAFANLNVAPAAGANTLVGCTLRNSAKHGAYVDGQGSGADFPVTFVGCSFSGNSVGATGTYSDIFVNNRTSVAVTGCTFTWPGAPATQPKYTIQFAMAFGPVQWAGNTVGVGAFVTAATTTPSALVASQQAAYDYGGRQVLVDPTGPTDAKQWSTNAASSVLQFSATSDAGLDLPWMTVLRSGAAATMVRITPPFRLDAVPKSSLPNANVYNGALVYVPDDAAGRTIAFSDGTNWLRIGTNTVIS